MMGVVTDNKNDMLVTQHIESRWVMLNHKCLQNIYCYDFPFSFHFTLLFDPHSIPFHLDHIPFLFPCHFSTRLSLFPLSMTHKPWGLLLLLFPHCLALPYTARHCFITHTDSLSPQGCASPLFPFHMTSYDSTLIFYWTTLCPTVYI